jgi:hypothetical protein
MERDLLVGRQPQHSEGLLPAAIRRIFALPLRFVTRMLLNRNDS